jgi:membrane protease YdiL (CAAX protease family)
VTRFLMIYAGMLVVAAWLASVSGCPSLFSLPESEALLVGSLVLAVITALIVVQAGKLLEHLPWYRSMAALLKRMLTSPDLLGPNLDSQKALVIAFYSSVGEEALFRGWLQPWLILSMRGWADAPEALWPVFLGILATSLIFGLVHFPVLEELRPWTVFAVLAGVLFGALAAWSGSLLAPALAHMLINWLNLRRLAMLPLDGFEGPAHP